MNAETVSHLETKSERPRLSEGCFGVSVHAIEQHCLQHCLGGDTRPPFIGPCDAGSSATPPRRWWRWRWRRSPLRGSGAAYGRSRSTLCRACGTLRRAGCAFRRTSRRGATHRGRATFLGTAYRCATRGRSALCGRTAAFCCSVARERTCCATFGTSAAVRAPSCRCASHRGCAPSDSAAHTRHGRNPQRGSAQQSSPADLPGNSAERASRTNRRGRERTCRGSRAGAGWARA